MADKTVQEDEYELLPHREIEELKEELAKLKEFEVAPSKRLQVSLLELNTKLDKLLTIFEDATHEMRIEEGGLSFSEKMKPLLEKMNKVLEQNSEIASGILALADMVKEMKEGGSQSSQPAMPSFESEGYQDYQEQPPQFEQGGQGVPPPPQQAPPAGNKPPGVPPGPPLPPVPPRRRTFGI